jgi:hypothetical protein
MERNILLSWDQFHRETVLAAQISKRKMKAELWGGQNHEEGGIDNGKPSLPMILPKHDFAFFSVFLIIRAPCVTRDQISFRLGVKRKSACPRLS